VSAALTVAAARDSAERRLLLSLFLTLEAERAAREIAAESALQILEERNPALARSMIGEARRLVLLQDWRRA
jgi:hypothetical protein